MMKPTEYYVIRRAYNGKAEKKKVYSRLSESSAAFERLVRWLNSTGGGVAARGVLTHEHVCLAGGTTSIEDMEGAREYLTVATLNPRKDGHEKQTRR